MKQIAGIVDDVINGLPPEDWLILSWLLDRGRAEAMPLVEIGMRVSFGGKEHCRNVVFRATERFWKRLRNRIDISDCRVWDCLAYDRRI